MLIFLSLLCVFVSEGEICGERGGAQARPIGNAPECVQVLGVIILFEYVRIRMKTYTNVRKISFISTGYDAYDIFYLMISFLVSYRRYRSYAVPNSINSNVAQIAGQCH